MPMYTFERIARTPHSEEWRIEAASGPIGRVDLHFTGAKAYGTLVVADTLPESEIEELIADVDARLVSTADEYREDFVVTVWRGEEFGTYSEDDSAGYEDVLDVEDDEGDADDR
ncbi:MAG: hypothetical protein WC273_09875 [Dehalococcoidia bacterium]